MYSLAGIHLACSLDMLVPPLSLSIPFGSLMRCAINMRTQVPLSLCLFQPRVKQLFSNLLTLSVGKELYDQLISWSHLCHYLFNVSECLCVISSRLPSSSSESTRLHYVFSFSKCTATSSEFPSLCPECWSLKHQSWWSFLYSSLLNSV